MPQLELTVTEGIEIQQAQRLATELRRHFEVDGPQPYFSQGRPVHNPPIHSADWSCCGLAAVALSAKWFLKPYLETLGPIAADATRDALAALFKKKEVKPLADVATALADAREASSGRVEIVVGLDIPDPHFGTALRITKDTAEEITYELAVFVTHADELSVTMKAEVEGGRAPTGRSHHHPGERRRPDRTVANRGVRTPEADSLTAPSRQPGGAQQHSRGSAYRDIRARRHRRATTGFLVSAPVANETGGPAGPPVDRRDVRRVSRRKPGRA